MVRRLFVFGIPALVLLAVVAGGGWWLFVREDNQLAEAAPEIPTDLQPQTATPGSNTPPAAQDGSQVFRIIGERSEAAYFADEKLARLSVPSTAKGTTKGVSGELHLTESGLSTHAQSKFTVDLRSLKSDEGMRDRRVQEALQTSRFPEATFTPTSLTGPFESLNPNSDTALQLTGKLTIRGVEREVTWDVKARRDGTVLTALATVNFRYEDFGVPVLNIGGFVSVEEDVTLQVQVTAQADA